MAEHGRRTRPPLLPGLGLDGGGAEGRACRPVRSSPVIAALGQMCPPFTSIQKAPSPLSLFAVLLPMGHSPSSQRTALPLMSLPARQRGGRAPVKGPQTRFHQSSVHPQPHPARVSTQTYIPPPLPISLSLGRIHASSWILDVPLDLVALVKFGLVEASMGLSGG